MASSLFGNRPNMMPQTNNIMDRVNLFKKQFEGQNPHTILDNAVKSGQISQAQVDQAVQMVKQMMK